MRVDSRRDGRKVIDVIDGTTAASMGIALTILNHEDEARYETTHLETTLLPEEV